MLINQISEKTYMTNSGIVLDPSNIQPDEINLQDIAHHLSSYSCCRFGGSLPHKIHYSVAAHSIILAEYILDKYYHEVNVKSLAKLALFHDATEAYIGDVVSGLKKHLIDYQQIESDLDRVIKDKYKIKETDEWNFIIKDIDTRIILDEVHALMPHHLPIFKNRLPNIGPLGVAYAVAKMVIHEQGVKGKFLRLCDYLGISDEI